MLWKKGMNFCDISPTCYAISVKKEILKRHIKNLMSSDKLAKTKSDEILPNVVSSHSSNMIKRAPGVDLTLQLNKAVNIDLAGSKINGIVIRPGETFSFWDAVGKITKKKGYKEGRVLKNNKLIAGMGGGLCNLSNTLHLLILHSPLEVTEFHKHSDALAPDEGKRKPFSAGTSVSYNNLDYRLRCEGETLIAELRSEKPYPYRYELFEEDHHFRMEGEVFYRNSMIYRNVFDAQTDELVEKEFVHKNHSKVMFDYDLIPKELIRK